MSNPVSHHVSAMHAVYSTCEIAHSRAKALSKQNYRAVGDALAAYLNNKTNANLTKHKVASAVYGAARSHLCTTRSARNYARTAYLEACTTPPTPIADDTIYWENVRAAERELARQAAIDHDDLLNTVLATIRPIVRVTDTDTDALETSIELHDVSFDILQALDYLIQHPNDAMFTIRNTNQDDIGVCTVRRHTFGFYYEHCTFVYSPTNRCTDRVVIKSMYFCIHFHLHT